MCLHEMIKMNDVNYLDVHLLNLSTHCHDKQGEEIANEDRPVMNRINKGRCAPELCHQKTGMLNTEKKVMKNAITIPRVTPYQNLVHAS